MKTIIASIALSALAFTGVILGSQTPAQADFGADANYREECINEGCSYEEVLEIYHTYAGECIAASCYYEEKMEAAGGGPAYVNAMESNFRNNGWQTRDAVDE